VERLRRIATTTEGERLIALSTGQTRSSPPRITSIDDLLADDNV
jgi:hypothetical protein